MPDENTLGREVIVIVEIDQDFCSRTYGVAPCTAAIGTTGTFKCYNTRTTCQDSDNYLTGTAITLRFCSKAADFPTGAETVQYLPFVESVSTSPMELNIAAGNSSVQPLGARESVTIKMRDAPYDDYLVDNYLSTRGFNPLDRSFFWVKWLARNEFYQNRSLRIRRGYVGQTVANMETSHYFIDKIVGVDSNGGVTITAKDVLGFAENNRSQAPLASQGVLDADITAGETSITLLPVGIGASEYPASGSVAISDEVMTFTRSGDVLTVIRAQNNTTASAHNEGDTVQLCLVYAGTRVDAVIEDLLTTYGNVDASYITTANWTAEADTWLADTTVNTVITKPTGVAELVGELCEQGTCFIWWDAINQTIPFLAVRPVSKASIIDITSEANIVADSVQITRQPNQRLSQIWTYYRQIDPTDSLDKTNNYSALGVRVDLDAESADQYGESRVRKIFSRWFKAENDAQVVLLGSRILTSYLKNPIYVTFNLDAKDRSLDIADVIRFNHRSFVDAQGDNKDTLLQVISREEISAGHTVRYKCQIFGFIGNFANIMANSANDFDSATQNEKDTGGYISNNSGLMNDGSDGYKIS